MEQNNNQKTTFLLPEDTNITEVLEDLLNKYRLSQTSEEINKKISEGKEYNLPIVKKIAISLAKKEIDSNSAQSLLQDRLATTKEIAEGLLNDIYTKLIPFSKTFYYDSDGNPIQNSESRETDLPKIKAPIEVEKIMEEREKSLLKEKVVVDNQFNHPVPTKTKKSVTIKKPAPTETVIKQNHTGPDSYREPIE